MEEPLSLYEEHKEPGYTRQFNEIEHNITEFDYQQFLDSLPVAAYTCSSSGHIQLYNKASVMLFGRELLAGKDLWCGSSKAYHIDGRPLPASEHPLAMALKEARPAAGMDMIIERPDGSRRTVRTYPCPILDRNGLAIGAVNIVTDITEQGTALAEAAQAALQDSEARYQQLMKHLPAALYTCDAEGRITMYNDAAAKLWGRRPVIGQDLWCGSWKIFYPDGSPMPLEDCPMAITLKEGRPVLGKEIIIERPDGNRRFINPFPQPIFSAAGKLTGAFNMLLDITGLKNEEKESAHLAAIVASSDDAIISKTLEGIITSWNKAAERIFGYTSEEMIGQSITKLIPEERLDEEAVILAKLKKGERIEHFETKRVAKDKSILDISITTSPIRNRQGIIIGASKIARDITPQKQAERQIRKGEALFRMAVGSSQLGTWEYLPAEDKFSWSSESEKIWGLSPDTYLTPGQLLSHVFPRDIPALKEHALNALRTATDINARFRIIRHDNQELRWLWIQGKALPPDNAPERFVGTMLDITDEKMATEKLEKTVQERTHELLESNKRLEKSNHDLEQFAYIASHDLQEPLRKIRLFADILLRELHNDEKVSKYISKIESSANHMSRLIRDVLNYSRLTKQDHSFVDINLNTVLADVLSEFDLLIEQRQAVIHHANNLPLIKGIPVQLNQLFRNLIGNSLKFSGDHPEIEISCRNLSVEQLPVETGSNSRDWVVLSFRDNGIGFDQRYADQIFSIFKRLNNTDVYKGTGVGLALCKKIAENHHGFIVAESEEMKGATFNVYLPLQEISA